MLFEKIRALVAEQFSVDEDTITAETSFVDDLGADSLDIVELTMVLEEEFGIPETEEEPLVKLQTVGDVVTYVANFVGEN